MANSNNVYATAKPLEGTVSDWVQNQQQNDLAYREEQRKIAAIDERRKEKEQAKKDALRKNIFDKIPQNYDTGSSSLNEFQAKLIQKAVNRKGEIWKSLSNPSISDDERIKLEIENQNLDNLPENLQVATKNFTGVIEDYKNGVSKGNYFRNPDFESKVLSGFQNYVGGLDNGLPVVGFVDRDGDGKMDILPYESLSQSLGPNSENLPWQFQKQHDLDALAQKTGEKLGKTEKTTDRNFTKRTITGPDLNNLETITNDILLNPDGSPTSVMLSEFKKRGLKDTEENRNKVKTIFKDRVIAFTDSVDKTDVDYGAMNSAASERRQSKKDRENIPEIGTPVPASEQAWGKQYSSLDTKNKLSVPVAKGVIKIPAFNAKVGTKEGKPVYKNITDATIDNYTYNKDGRLVVDVSYPAEVITSKDKDTGISQKIIENKKEQITVTPETESRIAKNLGMTVEELRNSATKPNTTKAGAYDDL